MSDPCPECGGRELSLPTADSPQAVCAACGSVAFDPSDDGPPGGWRLPDDETVHASVGPLEMDVELARDLGWTQAQIERVWAVVERLSRSNTRVAAWREGRRESCEVCDRWIEKPGMCECHRTSDGEPGHVEFGGGMDGAPAKCEECEQELDPEDNVLGRWCDPLCAEVGGGG